MYFDTSFFSEMKQKSQTQEDFGSLNESYKENKTPLPKIRMDCLEMKEAVFVVVNKNIEIFDCLQFI